jgi:hypothetical protein
MSPLIWFVAHNGAAIASNMLSSSQALRGISGGTRNGEAASAADASGDISRRPAPRLRRLSSSPARARQQDDRELLVRR